MIASVKRNGLGEQLLCLRRPGTESKAPFSFNVSGLTLRRHWGILASTDRAVELSVPGDKEGDVWLVLDTYDSMQRLAKMVLGRTLPDPTLQAVENL